MDPSVLARRRFWPPVSSQLAERGVGAGTGVPLVPSSTDCTDPIGFASIGIGGTTGVTGSITSVTVLGVTVVFTGGKTGSVTVFE
jgi:hypothetical protein